MISGWRVMIKTVQVDRVASIAGIVMLTLVPAATCALLGQDIYLLQDHVLNLGFLVEVVLFMLILMRVATINKAFRSGDTVEVRVVQVIRRVRSRTGTLVFGYTVDGAHYEARHDFLVNAQTREWCEGTTLHAVVDMGKPGRAFVVEVFA